TLLVANTYDNYPVFKRKERRTVITAVSLLIPLGSLFYLVLVRTRADLPSWEIFIATIFIVVTYFLTFKQILASRFEKYDISNPVLLEILFVGLINLTVFLALMAEMILIDKVLPDKVFVNYIFIGMYMVLQISFALISMSWKVEQTDSIVAQSLTSMLFVQGAFIAFFNNLGGVRSTVPVGYEIVLSISLSLLFIAPLISIIAL
ncbi:unnamed protein product, partial [marine sediment metagenome]